MTLPSDVDGSSNPMFDGLKHTQNKPLSNNRRCTSLSLETWEKSYWIQSSCNIKHRDLQSFEIRFNSNRPFQFDSKVMGRFENFRIGRACPLLVVVKRLKPLTVLSGAVYRLASSMSDHTPVLFNVFWGLEWGICSSSHLFRFDSYSIRTQRADSHVTN